MTEWRNVVGFDKYKVSNKGEIFSELRNKTLKPYLNKNHYLHVTLTKNSKQYKVKIHRIVARAFYGECPIEKEINHIDGVKLNNGLVNLEYITRSENHKHAFRLGLRNNTGENHPNAKLTEKDVLRIRGLIKNNANMKSLAIVFGVDYTTIWAIKNRRIWSHI